MYIVYRVSFNVLYNNKMTAETKEAFNFKIKKTQSLGILPKHPETAGLHSLHEPQRNSDCHSNKIGVIALRFSAASGTDQFHLSTVDQATTAGCN